MPGKHSFWYRDQKREGGTSLKKREHAREKKIDMGENLYPAIVQIYRIPQEKNTHV